MKKVYKKAQNPVYDIPSSVHYTKVRHQKNFLVSPFLDIVLKFSSFLSSAHWSSWIICINVDGGYRIYFSIFELIPLIYLWLEDFSWTFWVHSCSNKTLQKHNLIITSGIGCGIFCSSTTFGATSQSASGASSTPAFSVTTMLSFSATSTPAIGAMPTPTFEVSIPASISFVSFDNKRIVGYRIYLGLVHMPIKYQNSSLQVCRCVLTYRFIVGCSGTIQVYYVINWRKKIKKLRRSYCYNIKFYVIN